MPKLSLVATAMIISEGSITRLDSVGLPIIETCKPIQLIRVEKEVLDIPLVTIHLFVDGKKVLPKQMTILEEDTFVILRIPQIVSDVDVTVNLYHSSEPLPETFIEEIRPHHEYLCIRSYALTAKEGQHFQILQGEVYTGVTHPDPTKDEVVIFSEYVVPVPMKYLVPVEKP